MLVIPLVDKEAGAVAAVILVRAVVGGMGKRIGEEERGGALDGAGVCVCVCMCVLNSKLGWRWGKRRSGRSLGGALCPTLNGQDEAACPSATCGGMCEPHLDSYLVEP